MALYNYIYARQNGGKFILRIEDTDQTRLVPESRKDIEDSLNWVGLAPDEGPTLGGPYGPYEQSKRTELYNQYAMQLVANKRAYRCFCSKTRLDLLRKSQERNREKPRYDGKCRHLTDSEIQQKLHENNGKHVLRFVLNPGTIDLNDGIMGNIQFQINPALDGDFVILKSDGLPTYHLANIVDDHLMNISHVLRGAEWVSSAPMHLQLYNALGWQSPRYLHFPLINMSDGKKMSKRNANSQVRYWKEQGYRPRAILNFLLNMGGGLPKSKQDSHDIWNLDRIISEFNFKAVSSHSSSVDMDRLNIYNNRDLFTTYTSDPDSIVRELRTLLKYNDIDCDMNDTEIRATLDKFIGVRVNRLNELLSSDKSFIWAPPILTWSKDDYTHGTEELMKIVEDVIKLINDCGDRPSDKALKDIANKHNMQYSTFMQFFRLCLTNSRRGLPISELTEFLGKHRVRLYLNRAIEYINKL